LGDFQIESAKLRSLIGDESEDAAHFTLKQSSGLEGEIDASWCMDNYRMPELRLLLEGSKGIIDVSDDKVTMALSNGKSSAWYRHSLEDNVPFSLGGTEYFREDYHFIKSVLEGLDAEPSFDTASKVDFIIDEVKRRASESE
jgi:predicted dehydrogenase